MKRASSKKGVDRDEPPRKKTTHKSSAAREESASARSKQSKVVSQAEAKQQEQEQCFCCDKNLNKADRALFVEEENSRVFCSETCISKFFTPEISRLEKEYLKHVKSDDLSGHRREKFNHLRWITLQDPDEVWRIKTSEGDYRYTLISEFKPSVKSVWCICICLFLRGEPSFLYLAFPTRNEALVNRYRKGTRQKQKPIQSGFGKKSQQDVEQKEKKMNHEDSGFDVTDHEGNSTENGSDSELLTAVDDSSVSVQSDGLADAWTETETLRARLMEKGQQIEDIAPEDFGLYQSCMDETLETPDEIWSNRESPDKRFKVFHFIRFYDDEKPGVWFIVVARETEDAEEIELMDAFPTRDPELVECYRRGAQEVGGVPLLISTTKFMH